MYKIGDYVIYQNGVGQIISINEEYAHLLTYPISQEIKVSTLDIIRKICSVDKINEVIERIAYIQTLQIPHEKWNYDIYHEAMSAYDELEWVKVIKSEYLRKKNKRIQNHEKQMAKQAKEFLYSEISLLKGVPYFQVEKYIYDYIHNDDWQ